MRYPSLGDQFEKLRSDHPELSEGAVPLGAGAFGIVISRPDDRVTKVLFDHRQLDYGLSHVSDSMFKREMEFFKAMEPVTMPGVDIPRLVEEPTPLAGGWFRAHYTMTRVPGRSEYWPYGAQDNPAAYYGAVGNVLGKLHRAFERIDTSLRREFAAPYTSRIVKVNTLDDATNERLAKADALLQTLKKPGFVHGDFHYGNVMVNRGTPSGAIDLSSAGYVDNMYDDLARGIWFSAVPPEHVDSLLKGYGEAAGVETSRLLLKCTILSRVCHIANWTVGKDDHAEYAEKVKATLNETARLAYERRRAAESPTVKPV